MHNYFVYFAACLVRSVHRHDLQSDIATCFMERHSGKELVIKLTEK